MSLTKKENKKTYSCDDCRKEIDGDFYHYSMSNCHKCSVIIDSKDVCTDCLEKIEIHDLPTCDKCALAMKENTK